MQWHGGSDRTQRDPGCTLLPHLSFATSIAGLLDLTSFHRQAVLVGGDELDGAFLWRLSHG